MAERTDVFVAGAGPAGCAAAVQCARLGLGVVLADGRGEAGGTARNARLVENLPALEEPVSGPELAARLAAHLRRWGLEVRRLAVRRIERAAGGFLVETDGGTVLAGAVVVATGTRPVKLGVKGEEELRRAGRLFYEPADAHARKAEAGRVIVVGGGEAAFDYALGLADRGRK